MTLTLPNATRTTSARHDTPEWHAARRVGIGGSDASIILGANPWTTPRQLWELKTKRRQPDAGNAFTRCGQLLEDAILDRVYYGHATRGVKYGSMRSTARPHMLANIDGVYEGRLVEIKTTGKPWRDVPAHYVAQIRHYLYVCGLTEADLIECHVEYDRRTVVQGIDYCGLRPDRVVEHMCSITTHKVAQDEAWLEHYLREADAFWAAVESDTWTKEESPF